MRQTNEADSAFDVLEGRRIPLVWYKAGEDIRFYRLSSRPVPVPQNTNSWTVGRETPNT